MNFAIIGCGVIAFTHHKALEALKDEDCNLYAVCDIVKEKADKFAKERGIEKVYYDYKEVLKDENVDIVCVCVPSGTHGEICIAASKAKKAIVCEKPMEITANRIREIIKQTKQNNTIMQSIFQRRTMRTAIAVREIVKSGKLGKICQASADLKYYRDQAYYNSAGWRGTWEEDGGGALMNQGVHGVDLILWMLNDQVKSVYGLAKTISRDIAVEDTASAVVEMKKGTICTIQGATTAYPGFSSTFSVHGELGSIVFNDEGILVWEFLDEENAPQKPDSGESVGGASDPTQIGCYGHIVLLRNIANAVKGEEEILIPPEDAVTAVEVICAIYESTKTSKPVVFD